MVLEVLKFQFQKEKPRKGLYYSFNSIVSPSLLISQKGMFFSSVNSFMRQLFIGDGSLFILYP